MSQRLKKVNNPLDSLLPGEQVVCEIKRHPIGVIAVYLGAAIVLIIAAIFVFGIAPHTFSADQQGQATRIGAVAFVLLSILIFGFVWAYNTIYWGNAWIVTNIRVTEISQLSLFAKDSSQLSLGNLEDVTSERHGFLQTIFNYGTLKAETAGEAANFIFPFCPNPGHHASLLLDAREKFELGRRAEGVDAQRLYRGPGTYSPEPPTQLPNVDSYEVPTGEK